MNRTQLIKKAQKIEAKYYQEVKDCRTLNFDKATERKAIIEWSIAMEVLAEFLEMTEDEYFEYFMNSTPVEDYPPSE